MKDSTAVVKNGLRIPYRDAMALAKVLVEDSCPLGSLEARTVAHTGVQECWRLQTQRIIEPSGAPASIITTLSDMLATRTIVRKSARTMQ